MKDEKFEDGNEGTNPKIVEENEKNEILVNDFRESNFKEPKTFTLKHKIIIIVGVSLIIIGIATVVTLILLKKGDVEVLPPVIIEPTSEYTHCIIWLHGYDNCPENFISLFGDEIPFMKKNNTKIILMRAPNQTVTYSNETTTSWFDILRMPINASDTYNFNDVIQSRKVLEKVINQEAKLLNGKYQNIYVGGHSQGACVSLYTAYNFEELLGGVLVCSGVLFPQAEIVGDKNKLKVFLGHGYRDLAIPMYFHNETVKRIENYEGVHKYYYETMGHNIGDDEKFDMGGFLNKSMI